MNQKLFSVFSLLVIANVFSISLCPALSNSFTPNTVGTISCTWCFAALTECSCPIPHIEGGLDLEKYRNSTFVRRPMGCAWYCNSCRTFSSGCPCGLATEQTVSEALAGPGVPSAPGGPVIPITPAPSSRDAGPPAGETSFIKDHKYAIGAGAAVVIAGVSYYAWSKYKKAQRKKRELEAEKQKLANKKAKSSEKSSEKSVACSSGSASIWTGTSA